MDIELIEKTVLPHLSFYKDKNKGGYPCIYGVTEEGGSFVNLNYTACHGGLMKSVRALPKQMTSIINKWQFGSPCTAEIAKSYFNWLVNDSPYAEAFLIKDIELLEQTQSIVGSVEAEANYTAGAMIATRLPLEHPKSTVLWNKLAEAGVNQTVAFDFVHRASSNDVYFTISTSIFGALSHTSHPMYGWIDFLRGKHKAGKSFVVAGGYTGGQITKQWTEGDTNGYLNEIAPFLQKRETSRNNPFDQLQEENCFQWKENFPSLVKALQHIEAKYVQN